MSKEFAAALTRSGPQSMSKELADCLVRSGPKSMSKELANVLNGSYNNSITVSPELAQALSDNTGAKTMSKELATILAGTGPKSMSKELADVLVNTGPCSMSKELAAALYRSGPTSHSKELAEVLHRSGPKTMSKELADAIVTTLGRAPQSPPAGSNEPSQSRPDVAPNLSNNSRQDFITTSPDAPSLSPVVPLSPASDGVVAKTSPLAKIAGLVTMICGEKCGGMVESK